MPKRELDGEEQYGPRANEPRSGEPALDEAGPIETEFDSAELESFARSLADLRPRPTRLDRDRLMFLAGQADRNRTYQRRSRLSFAVTTSLGLASVVLIGLLIWRWDPRVVREVRYVNLGPENVPENVVTAEEPAPERTLPPPVVRQSVAAASRELPDNELPNASPGWPRPNYFQQRQTALTLGIDALPTPAAGGASSDAGADTAAAPWEHGPSPPILLEGRSGSVPALFEWSLFD